MSQKAIYLLVQAPKEYDAQKEKGKYKSEERAPRSLPKDNPKGSPKGPPRDPHWVSKRSPSREHLGTTQGALWVVICQATPFPSAPLQH